MNRQVTGWLAWGALALIVGVPSSEIIFSKGDGRIAVVEEKKTAASNAVVIGPMPISAGGPAAGRTIEPKIARPVGGDPALAATALPPPAQAAEEPSPLAGDEPQISAIAVAEASGNPRDAPVYKPIPIEFRTGSGKPVEVAALSGTELAPSLEAPIPMPVSLRPPTPERVLVARTGSRFEDDVRESIANIRGSRLVDEDLDEDFRWGDNPRFRREGRVLDSFDPGEFSEEDYAGDSEFYNEWEAFEDDEPVLIVPRRGIPGGLPARRGNGVRMDLLLR